jgi:hypothetical protein
MITEGSISREEATTIFPFLQKKYRGRRKDIKAFTHTYPEFVFWIYPNGRLFNAKDAHIKNTPKGFNYILKDEPNYGGFLRGRLARQFEEQIIVIYCESEALYNNIEKIEQFLTGIKAIPLPVSNETLVISDNGDIYGTISDIKERLQILV